MYLEGTRLRKAKPCRQWHHRLLNGILSLFRGTDAGGCHSRRGITPGQLPLPCFRKKQNGEKPPRATSAWFWYVVSRNHLFLPRLGAAEGEHPKTPLFSLNLWV